MPPPHEPSELFDASSGLNGRGRQQDGESSTIGGRPVLASLSAGVGPSGRVSGSSTTFSIRLSIVRFVLLAAEFLEVGFDLRA